MNELTLLIIKITVIILGVTILIGSIYPEKSKCGKLYHNFIIGTSVILTGGSFYFIWKSDNILEIIIALFTFILSGYIAFNEFEKSK